MRFGPCDGVSTVGGGVRKPGFKVSGGLELSFSGFCKIAACVNLGVRESSFNMTREGGGGVKILKLEA